MSRLVLTKQRPGYFKEQKVVSIYMQATGSSVQIVDNNFQSLDFDNDTGIEQSICRYCTAHCRSCREAHINAIRESSYHGNSHIYQCELGLLFWISPIYSDGKFSGVLRGSGYLSDKMDMPAFTEKYNALCDKTIAPDKFMRRVLAIPPIDAEKTQSLSEMLLLCAKSLSSGNEDYHEVLMLRSKQQSSLFTLLEELKAKHPKGSTLPYPLDKEQQLIASLHRGDKAGAEHLLNELLAVLLFSNQNQFRHIQLRALELAVLLTRAGIHSGGSIAAECNTRYLKQIQEAKTIEELMSTLHSIIENIADQITSFQGIPHASALRKAESFIRENLTRKISLREIAKVAGLSGPYFSTIFKEEMGENLSRYINRLRVEKAGKMLLETDFCLSDISAACCFEDQSWFSKIFKSFTGISPGKYRSQGGQLYSAVV
ncbi:MAG: helix-turn-helix domain-containing protein [Treponema sp.]|nr:helix-turn-helix domain-containing protein [Treponema sp.]